MMPRALAIAVLLAAAGISVTTQGTRRLTTVDALRQFPGFYHLQPVLVRGELVEQNARISLRTEEHEIRLLVDPNTRVAPGPVEVRGTLLDVGRLEPGDGRLNAYERPADLPWPKPGEELLIQVASATAHTPGAPLSPRVLALEPWRFDGQSVTLTGQFRGRNLFGDLPGAPRKSQYDFVLKNGDAFVWVVGMRPRGKGFDLNVDARIDTNQWLEVTGVARRYGGLVTIEASRLTLAKESTSTEREEPAAPPPLPPVEVVFSDPTMGEGDVPATTTVRIQFSRNIKPETLKGHMTVNYADATPPQDGVAPAIEWKTRYDSAARAVEVSFVKPLEKLRPVKVELIDGVLAFDGAPLVPWSMTFTVGG
jgi:hypothetical protein